MTIEIEDGKPPEWMIALENKQKRHHKLAHDIGAGAPCLNCNNGCVGLDLHFWRKICRNCKCKKEFHDVKEENSYEQFEILFGDNLKSGDRVKQLSLNLKLDDILTNAKETQQQDITSKSTTSDDNLIFDWIPTDIPTNLASEYLQQLPLEKLPITGSAGAMFRRQQLQKQMPLHDFKINNANDLTEEETKAFTEYVDNLKSNAVGKGQITKIFLENYPDNDSLAYNRGKLPAFQNNLNFTPKPFKASYDNGMHSFADSDSFPPPPPELLHGDGSSLKTPSAFVPYKQFIGMLHPHESKSNTESIPYIQDKSILNQQKENSTSISGIEPQYAQMDMNSKALPSTNDHMIFARPKLNSLRPEMREKLMQTDPKYFNNFNQLEQRENSAPLNKTTSPFVPTTNYGDAGMDYLNCNPQKLNSMPFDGLASQYSLMNINNKSTAIPYTVEENRNYAKQKETSTALNRIPAQYTQTIENTDTNALDTKNNNWYLNNDQDGTTESIKPSDIIRKLNSRPVFPVNESVKNTPNNRNIPTLNDSTTKNVDGKFIKMGTPEQFQALSSYVPRSPQVSNSLINPEAKHYHLNDSTKTPKVHFGPSIVSVYDNDTNNVVDPYQSMEQRETHKLQKCHHCKLPAYPGQVVVVAERAGIEVIWHPQCFVCVNCQELLVDLVYFFHKGEVYCGRHYAEELNIPRCFACDELIFVKEYTVAEGQSFHVKHFCCFECDTPLGGMQYVPKDDNPVCLSCYEIKYGKKCHYCDKMIKVGDSRVGWKELSWHAVSDCFKCFQCSKSLLGGKFVVKDNKPLCSKECAMKL